MNCALGAIAEAFINIAGVLDANGLHTDFACKFLRLLGRVVVFNQSQSCALGAHFLVSFVAQFSFMAVLQDSRTWNVGSINTDVNNTLATQILVVPE